MNNDIRKSLIDKKTESNNYNPKIIINENFKGIKNTILNNLEDAERFDIAVSYVVWSGFSLLKKHLVKFNSKSRFILTSESLVTDPKSLKTLLDLNIQVKVYDPYSNGRGFHLKSYMFEKENETTLLVGSNNISLRALGDVHEMAMEVNATKEGYIIEKYNKTFEDIWNDTASIDLTLDFIESYEEVFKMKRTLEDTYLKYKIR